LRPETPWQAGRLGRSSGPHRLLFGEMHEDAEIERTAFRGNGRVFCIASAGSTAFALADQHEVVACDINPAQLAYAERRARGVPAETGDAERAMNVARALMPLVGWRPAVVRAFLALSNVADQMAFWKEHLDTRRFRAGFDALMSPLVLRAVYASAFLSFLPSRFGAVLRALLLGEASTTSKPRIQNIRFVAADAASWLESCPPRCFDGFTLSNILDGAEPSYRARLAEAVRRAATEEAVVVWRSFAEPRADLATNRAECDRSMLWGVVDVCSAQTFLAAALSETRSEDVRTDRRRAS
jgi:hypothetical protein